jgi:hypothetical protein
MGHEPRMLGVSTSVSLLWQMGQDGGRQRGILDEECELTSKKSRLRTYSHPCRRSYYSRASRDADEVRREARAAARMRVKPTRTSFAQTELTSARENFSADFRSSDALCYVKLPFLPATRSTGLCSGKLEVRKAKNVALDALFRAKVPAFCILQVVRNTCS